MVKIARRITDTCSSATSLHHNLHSHKKARHVPTSPLWTCPVCTSVSPPLITVIPRHPASGPSSAMRSAPESITYTALQVRRGSPSNVLLSDLPPLTILIWSGPASRRGAGTSRRARRRRTASPRRSVSTAPRRGSRPRPRSREGARPRDGRASPTRRRSTVPPGVAWGTTIAAPARRGGRS